MLTKLKIPFRRAPLSHCSDAVIVDFLEFGWPVNYVSDTFPTPFSHNHPSAIKHASDVCQFTKNIRLSATAGPFPTSPLPCTLMLSPLLTVPKKNSSSCRIVMDLSFPPEHSVNSGIPTETFIREPFQLSLPSVDALANLVQYFGSGCSLFKLDLSQTYFIFCLASGHPCLTISTAHICMFLVFLGWTPVFGTIQNYLSSLQVFYKLDLRQDFHIMLTLRGLKCRSG